ncbi:hypothetical protein, partial [Enterobacter hormaechei]|uniref:hypothetical protein n=1 Tax=Enterobacter hormaechei TaxID=158836 RepID=UPI0013D7C0BF
QHPSSIALAMGSGEKQQLTVNEIEKLKEKIKKNTVYYDNAKTMISSMITQCKILLFELYLE